MSNQLFSSKHGQDEDILIILSENSYIVQGPIPKELIPELSDILSIRPEKPDTVIIMGKRILTPRFVAHYLKSYNYSGRTHIAKPLPDIWKPLLDWCNTTILNKWKYEEAKRNNIIIGELHQFNQAMVNYYMNGLHYIGRHSDDEKQILNNFPIFSASFGQERTFRIRNKVDGGIVRDIVMKDGSFLLMCGNMQKEFTHEVPKVLGKKGESLKCRINITFRNFT